MRVLVTGAFGNIGRRAVDELVSRGHAVTAFDMPTPANQKAARRMARPPEIVWGDLRRSADVRQAVQGQDAVVHLAYVIPKLSATGTNSEDQPDWARAINVGGTMHLLAALQALPVAPRVIFASSLHVFGHTQHQPPPRSLADPVQPVEHYGLHKVACEEMVKASGLPWAIFRLAACMPIRLILDPGMFDVPLDNRIEYVHARDVARAIANGLETDQVWGKTWLIGGGTRCQYRYEEIVRRVLDTVGVGMLPPEAFATAPFATDWLDTAESQRVLAFQQRTLDDYVEELRSALGPLRHLVRLARPIIRRRLLSMSPYYRSAQASRLSRAQRPPARDQVPAGRAVP